MAIERYFDLYVCPCPKKRDFLLFHYFVFNINSISFPVLYSFNINKDKDKHEFQNDEIAVLKLLLFEIFFCQLL